MKAYKRGSNGFFFILVCLLKIKLSAKNDVSYLKEHYLQPIINHFVTEDDKEAKNYDIHKITNKDISSKFELIHKKNKNKYTRFYEIKNFEQNNEYMEIMEKENGNRITINKLNKEMAQKPPLPENQTNVQSQTQRNVQNLKPIEPLKTTYNYSMNEYQKNMLKNLFNILRIQTFESNLISINQYHEITIKDQTFRVNNLYDFFLLCLHIINIHNQNDQSIVFFFQNNIFIKINKNSQKFNVMISFITSLFNDFNLDLNRNDYVLIYFADNHSNIENNLLCFEQLTLEQRNNYNINCVALYSYDNIRILLQIL